MARFLALVLAALASGQAGTGDSPSGSRFPSLPAGHTRARDLLENAMSYASPANKIVDPVSGYPFEGWNHVPNQGLHLRAFTQLTAT